MCDEKIGVVYMTLLYKLSFRSTIVSQKNSNQFFH